MTMPKEVLRGALDRLRGLFSPGRRRSTTLPAEAEVSSEDFGTAHKPRWEKQTGQRVRWRRRDEGGLVEQAPVEQQICPTCKAPMLVEWGPTCPRCRPKMAVAKTVALTAADLRASTGLVLGWLVVLDSPDKVWRGKLIELDQAVTILSRSQRPPVAGTRCIVFEDGYMSTAHATIRRPFAAGRESAFVITDRKDPGPSSNGVFVNAIRLPNTESRELADGDIVRLGTTELIFRSLYLPPTGTLPQ
ncbi:MAG TPA: FHA domain-containing protein [Polyangia bacterium]